MPKAVKLIGLTIAGGVAALATYIITNAQNKTEREMMEDDMRNYIDEQIAAKSNEITVEDDEPQD